jgi:hypothetical protein
LHNTGISVVLPVKMYSFIIFSVPTDLFFFFDHQTSPSGEMMHQATVSLKVAKSLKRRRKCTKSYQRFTNYIYICILYYLPFSIDKNICGLGYRFCFFLRFWYLILELFQLWVFSVSDFIRSVTYYFFYPKSNDLQPADSTSVGT